METIRIDACDPDFKYVVDTFFESGTLGCFTCNTCSAECPVNNYVGGLDPRKIVRMAAFGMKEELLGSIEIWLCMQCGKCTNVCPQKVEPASAITYLRYLAIKEGFVPQEFPGCVDKIDTYFHRLRQTVYNAFLNKMSTGADKNIDALVKDAVVGKLTPSQAGASTEESVRIQELQSTHFRETHFTQCLTCRECTTSCVVSRNVESFDPVKIMRMYYLGLGKKLFVSPELWLCLSCETCAEVCKQGVKGNVLIKRLKEEAVEKGLVPSHIWEDLKKIDRSLYEIRSSLITEAWERKSEAASLDIESLAQRLRK